MLCGGRSRRMGQAKAWLPWGDTPLVQHTATVLAQVVEPVIVVAAPDQAVPPLPQHIAVVRDPIAYQGPLRGIHTALSALAEQCDAVYVSSCDVPLLRPAFVRRLIELSATWSICLPEVDGRVHPLAGVYRVHILPQVERLLQTGERRPAALLAYVPSLRVPADQLRDVDPELASLRNINTPADYEQARQAGAAS